jgi:hypothetical protein
MSLNPWGIFLFPAYAGTFPVNPYGVWMPNAWSAREVILQATYTWSILPVCQFSSLHHKSKPPISAFQRQNLAKITFLCSVLHAAATLCARSDSRSHRWEACIPSLDSPTRQKFSVYMEVLPVPPTGVPHMRDKISNSLSRTVYRSIWLKCLQ